MSTAVTLSIIIDCRYCENNGMLILLRKLNYLIFSQSCLISCIFRDEADIVADRIAVMSNGEVMCSGSPLFLKIRS